MSSRSNFTWRALAAGVVTAVALSVAGCAGANEPAPAPDADTVEKATIALGSGTFYYAGILAGVEAGIFEEAGLDLEVTIAENGSAATTILLAGDVDFAGSGLTEVVVAFARQQPIQAVSGIYYGLSADLVLSASLAEKLAVTADSPISDRLAVLDGLKVAVPSATSAFLPPYRDAAAAVGVAFEEVYLAQTAMGAALQSGAIDAMIAGAPYSTATETQGFGKLWISGPGRDLPEEFLSLANGAVQVTESTISKRPGLVEKMRTAMRNLAEFINNEGDAFVEALEVVYPDVDPAVLRAAYEENKDAWSHPDLVAADIEWVIDQLIKQKVDGLTGLDQIDPMAVIAD